MRGFILLAIVAVASARPEAGYSYRAPGGHSGGGHAGHGHSSHGHSSHGSSFGGGASFGGGSSFGTSGSGRFQQFAFNKWVEIFDKNEKW